MIIMLLDVVNSLPSELIPRVHWSNGCPTNTQYKRLCYTTKANCEISETCSCEEHCAWNLCRLTVPPHDCILETNSEWQWDTSKNAWVAQIIQGKYF